MHEKREFPYYLSSFNKEAPEQFETLQLRNYFPRSEILQKSVATSTVEKQCNEISANTLNKMKQMNIEGMLQSGKINIYPKKNTIDLKNHLQKKSKKLDRKTEKALAYLAKQLLTSKRAKNSQVSAK